MGWSCRNVMGQSRGIITMWKKDYIVPIFSFKGEGFLGVKVPWKNNSYYVVNVYSACCLSMKTKMWSAILDLKKKMVDGLWILGGYFNPVSKSSERKGSLFVNRKSEKREIKTFINELNLLDLPYSRNPFR